MIFIYHPGTVFGVLLLRWVWLRFVAPLPGWVQEAICVAVLVGLYQGLKLLSAPLS